MTDTDMLARLAEGVLDTSTFDINVLPDIDEGQSIESSERSPYPRELHLLAFRLWTYEAGRDIGKLSKLLKERTGVAVPAQTLCDWRDTEYWVQAAPKLNQAFSSLATATVEATLNRGRVKAAQWLVDCLSQPDDVIPASVKLRAAQSILERTMGLPRLSGSIEVNHHTVGEFVDIPDAELRRLEESYNPDDAILPDAEDMDPAEIELMQRERRAITDHRLASKRHR